ncbi:MAG TPA: dihydrofolate reductase [Patescibacteria group bacterium]|jgi:dihydrofolate reductase|nr:dihydrofolate reductase [Patescibacteria group bacterium]
MSNNNLIIGILVAITKNGWIGMCGKLPWEYVGKKLDGDLPRFKQTTIGAGSNAIIFGRKTLESFGKQALPGRLNIVLSRDPDYIAPKDVTRYFSYDDAIDTLKHQRINGHAIEEIWICGGKTVYEEALRPGRNRATVIIKTVTHDDYEGDVAFPNYDIANWQTENIQKFDDKGYDVITQSLIRLS